MRKFLLLLTVAAVIAAMMVLIVPAIAQSDPVAFAAEKKEKKDKDKKDKKGKEETTVVTEGTQPYIPKSGGPSLLNGGLLLPSVAMLLAIGVLGFAVLRKIIGNPESNLSRLPRTSALGSSVNRGVFPYFSRYAICRSLNLVVEEGGRKWDL